MTYAQISFIKLLLSASVLFVFLPFAGFIINKIYYKVTSVERKNSGFNKLLVFSGFLIGSIWCLRYAVGYYGIVSPDSNEAVLSWYEEIFNSFVHALQTFSMDEDYTSYIIDGKLMIREIVGQESVWEKIYGVYASALNFIAPIAGGAIIFEIIASVFPRLRLRLSFLAVWKEKYYFNELNEFSLALAKSIRGTKKIGFFEPILVFTDTYLENEKEKKSEMMLEAKRIGAICVSDDLSHVAKNRFGRKRFFLMDEEETANLQSITNLASKQNYRYLKKSQIFFFVQNGVYTQIEKSIQEKLKNEFKVKDNELPVFIPIRSYRNMISNLLVDIPLYEPLVNKPRNKDGTVDLNVSILGTGIIGKEMFLSTYWIGQMLNCNLNITIISQESEEHFWGEIDCVNPEIYHTTKADDDILLINRKGDRSPVYCKVCYIQTDVKSDKFIKLLESDSSDCSLLDTDYFFVGLGSDADNMSIANILRDHIGKYHIEKAREKKTVIAYVVYNSDLADTLNRTRHYRFSGDTADIYMQAVGSLQEVYGTRNVFMTDHAKSAEKADAAYLSARNKKELIETHRGRTKDDYRYWASSARAMHLKYKVFSLGFITRTVFDTSGINDPEYISAFNSSLERYKNKVTGNITFADDEERSNHIELLHHMAWLEHRRWCSFTRVYGFRHTSSYKSYYSPDNKDSYKQMDIKLHPCLVECDKNGILADVDEKCRVTSFFKEEDESVFDFLDELTYEMYRSGFRETDFKNSDYPIVDFKNDLSEEEKTRLKMLKEKIKNMFKGES